MKLNDQCVIPVLGFGTSNVINGECIRSIEDALDVGYRHIDTADVYDNHEPIGKAVKNSGIKRQNIFITSKIWKSDLKPEELESSLKRFLDELQTDYIDLLLIHWPNEDISHVKSILKMYELKDKGLIRSVGVSNFTVSQIQTLKKELAKRDHGHFTIDNHQFEFHPSFQQDELLDFTMDNLITVTAYSPLGQGEDLELDDIQKIAEKYNCEPAQVILAWLRQKNIIAIVKSTNKKHMKENYKSLDLNLTKHEINIINGLDKGNRLVDPEFAYFK